MAVVQNALIGRTRGSIGGVTFSTQFGLNVAKSKAVSVANPNTDKQIMRRSALSQITAIGRQLLGIISVTFRSLAVGKSAYNAFSSLALKSAFDYSTPPTAEFVPADLVISKGTIQATEIDTATVHAGLVSVEFSELATGVGQKASDLAVLVVGSSASARFIGAVSSAARSTGSVSIDASILGAGELNRRAEQREDEYETEAAWTIMYLAQVYAHGIMDEVDGLVELRDKLEHSA